MFINRPLSKKGVKVGWGWGAKGGDLEQDNWHKWNNEQWNDEANGQAKEFNYGGIALNLALIQREIVLYGMNS